MKKIILSSLCLAALSMTFLGSCKKEKIRKPTNNGTNPDMLVSNPLDFVGVEHNNLLEEYYNAVNLLTLSQRNDSEVLQNTINNVTSNYIANNSANNDVIDDANFAVNFISQNNYNYVQQNQGGNNLFGVESSQISITAENYLTDILDLMTDNDLDINSLQTRIQNILFGVNNNITVDREKRVLYLSIAVAKHSLIYWHDNFQKWLDLNPNYSNQSEAEGFSWKRFGTSDVKSAAGTAIVMTSTGAYAAMAVTGPGGWVAAGAVTVAAAGIGSCIDAIGVLWDWW